MKPKQQREVFAARRELGNVERLLSAAMTKLELVRQLLDKTQDPESQTD